MLVGLVFLVTLFRLAGMKERRADAVRAMIRGNDYVREYTYCTECVGELNGVSRFADDTASRRSHSRKQSQVLLSLGASAPRNGRGWGAAAAASRPFLPPLLRARLPCVLLRQNGMGRVAGADLRKRCRDRARARRARLRPRKGGRRCSLARPVSAATQEICGRT